MLIEISSGLLKSYMFLMNFGDELVKKESVSKNSRKISGMKTAHGSNMIPIVKNQIENITAYRQMIPRDMVKHELRVTSCELRVTS